MDMFGSIYLCPLRYSPQCSELTDCPDPEIIHSLGRRHFPNKLKGSDSGYQEWGLEGCPGNKCLKKYPGTSEEVMGVGQEKNQPQKENVLKKPEH